MQKDPHHNKELVTKGYLDHTLRYRFGRFHTLIKKEIQEESHALEFRIHKRFERVDLRFEMIDKRFDAIDKRLESLEKNLQETNLYVSAAVNRVLELADTVIGEHKKFETESAVIKHNYEILEERVNKVETVVFPTH